MTFKLAQDFALCRDSFTLIAGICISNFLKVDDKKTWLFHMVSLVGLVCKFELFLGTMFKRLIHGTTIYFILFLLRYIIFMYTFI